MNFTIFLNPVGLIILHNMSCYHWTNSSAQKNFILFFHHRWCDVTVSEEILRDLLPGPVTLIFKRKPALNPDLNPATELVGVRIPDHQFIRETARICGEPIALTSANLSASQSCLKIEVYTYHCYFKNYSDTICKSTKVLLIWHSYSSGHHGRGEGDCCPLVLKTVQFSEMLIFGRKIWCW